MTVHEIAKLAGVTIGSVDRALMDVLSGKIHLKTKKVNFKKTLTNQRGSIIITLR